MVRRGEEVPTEKSADAPGVVEPTESVPAKEDVAVPWTMRFWVVVAPPAMVRPLVCVPPPMVEEAVTMRFWSCVRPLLKTVRSSAMLESVMMSPFVVALVSLPCRERRGGGGGGGGAAVPVRGMARRGGGARG